MNQINTLNIIDGNQYQVNTSQTVQTQSADFDVVYNEQAEESLDDIFARVADDIGVDVNLLKAVAQAESGFDAGAVSYCGAQGMMQLMPSTAESLGVEDPFDAEQSITGGAKVLAYLLDDYNGNVSLALAAYNAGSGNVAKYGGVPPFAETRNYISKINDLLGGALSSDGTTLEAANPTDLSQAAANQAPDVALHGEDNNLSGTDVQISSAGNNLIQGTTEPDTSDELFSFEEYMYFVETYDQIMEKLFQSVNTQMESDDSTTATAQEDMIRNLDHSGTLKYNVNQANYAMLSGHSMESILKSDAQSVYQAQASMISPLVERLLNK